VALFVQRAQDADTDFALTRATAQAVAAISARLDGLPLAIELAAAKLRILAPAQLLARLERQLPLLTGGARDVEARQQTMRATLAWSEDLLSLEQQRLFRRLGVFVGGFTLEAAEAVCAAPEGAEPFGLAVLDGLAALVDQSFVQQQTVGDEEEGGEARFRLLHVVREFALERLEESDGGNEAEALRQAHAIYFLALAEQAEHGLVVGTELAAWRSRLEREHDNFRAALSWTWERGEAELGLRLVTAVWRFWRARGDLREGREWLERLLELAERGTVPAHVRTRGLYATGSLAYSQGDYAAASGWLELAATEARVLGDRRTAVVTAIGLGTLATEQGDVGRAAARFAEGLALAREVGDWRGIAGALTGLGKIAHYRGDRAEAAARCEEAAVLWRQVGDPVWRVVLGTLALWEGELEQAMTWGRDALEEYRALGMWMQVAYALEFLGVAAGAAGQGERAARLLGAATLRETLGAPLPPQERAEVEQAVAAARSALGEAGWAAAFEAGRALSLEKVIAEALGESR
jgi:tetratricopeptide (TPR) repeat protein